MNRAFIIFYAAILTASWPDGDITHEAATTMAACVAAAKAAVKGIAVPEEHQGQKALTAKCVATSPEAAGFASDWDCIKGHNCPKGRDGGGSVR